MTHEAHLWLLVGGIFFWTLMLYAGLSWLVYGRLPLCGW